jgi:hypothetical protein
MDRFFGHTVHKFESMKFGIFHGFEGSGLLGCDTVLKVVCSKSKDCGTVILTLEDGGTIIGTAYLMTYCAIPEGCRL